MQTLHVGLQWLWRKQACAVAAAFDERDARRHRMTQQRFVRKDQWLLDQTMDQKLVHGRINLRNAVMNDGEK